MTSPTSINASIRLFEGGEQERAQYIVSHGFFKKGEIADICVRYLRADGELDTRQLAERVMCERKLDVSDTPLRNSVVFKVVQSLRHAERRKVVTMVDKRKGICVWSADAEDRQRDDAALRNPLPGKGHAFRFPEE